ncbi:MAG: SprT family zinc-dependent metalloprotease [Solidesulfovibrio sp.]|uniref:M48 family metallopeptidase n=1 Tax=Solidesulfovibrio sp. TaxID=2910990 RepID=UPI002B208ECA|nr:SprT family zinc-dependent metalloprotease [Solidesulfovibrio sp.]MEA4857666.1 SprT family zinc-dependent metalloprotease [Solidesulfovibrio sp.]
MAAGFTLGEMEVDVIFKDIKNIHLSVYPPAGKVRVAAPLRMNLDTIRVFTISKLDWIKKQQRKFLEQDRETPREYLERESHDLWGKRYLMNIVEQDVAPRVELEHHRIVLFIRPGTDERKRQEVVDGWYRNQLRIAAHPLISKWEQRLEVRIARLFIRKMKTRWGSCNPSSKSIRLNTDLAKKPKVCLEYIVVHELAHLIEPNHGTKFVELMDHFLPKWRLYREQLNRLPVSHEEWMY